MLAPNDAALLALKLARPAVVGVGIQLNGVMTPPCFKGADRHVSC